VDATTASAAELLAAALRDGAGARLVGSRSAGKGVGQKALLLADGSGLSLTRFRILAPSGRSWHGAGLVPDLAAEQPEGAPGEDAALRAAQALLGAIAD
jgi:carboxyl-terminal processing protease